MREWLENWFRVRQRGSSLGREARGALATFLTMAYILVVNPTILQAAGIPYSAAVACTALAAGVCCLFMGLYANFPLALASGMGLNAVVALAITPKAGSWQVAMGLVVLDGIVVVTLVLAGVRETMLRAIPLDLRRAIGAGIGIFIAFIGLVNARLVLKVAGETTPPVTFGSLSTPEAAVTVAGLALMAVLLARQVNGAVVLGILFASGLAHLVGAASWPTHFPGVDLSLVGQADVIGALRWGLMAPLLTLVLVDFFDTLGTVSGVAEQAGLQDEQGHIEGLRKVLVVDGVGASIGGLCGVSSVTCYVESAAGVAEGARTGLHTVLVGLLFLLAIPLAPLAALVPAAATAPALILVGFLMCEHLTRIDFTRRETAIPAFLTLVTLPLTWSITHGIGYGFLAYVVIMVFTRQARAVHPLMYGAAAVFAAYFLFG